MQTSSHLMGGKSPSPSWPGGTAQLAGLPSPQRRPCWARASSLGTASPFSRSRSLIALWNPDFALQPWQFFLLFLAIATVAFVLNVFGVRALPSIDRFAGVWSIVGFVVASIVCLACADSFQPPKAVFATFTNVTGVGQRASSADGSGLTAWPSFSAFSSPRSGSRRSTRPATSSRRCHGRTSTLRASCEHDPGWVNLRVLAIVLGATTSWVFMIVILFALQDFDAVLSAATGPLLQIYYQATSSRVGVGNPSAPPLVDTDPRRPAS